MTTPRDKTVLIVDDDETFRTSLHRTLSDLRHELPLRLLDASDGNQAHRLLKESDIDCVLLDFNIPDGDGLLWLSRFLEARPNLPVIMLNVAGNEHVAINAMKNGATDYLVKEYISPENLQRAISNALDRVVLRRTIELQRQELIEAERQRAMIESLGAACHHLGQPATVIRTALDILRRLDLPPEARGVLDQCTNAADSVADILHRLKQVSQFRTVPYRPHNPGESFRKDERILDI